MHDKETAFPAVTATQPEPEAFVATRYRCPFCRRSRSSKAATREHIARCWWNPAARSCKTCSHYYPGDNGCVGDPMCNCASPEDCSEGVDLTQSLPVQCPLWQLARAS